RRDPFARFAAYLKKKRLLDEGLEAAVDEEIAAAVARFEATGAADPLVMFDHVYAELPPDLKAQREALAEGLRSGEPGRREKHEERRVGKEWRSRWARAREKDEQMER